MHSHTTRGLETPERLDAPMTNCPVCGTPIDGLDADARTTVEPCGHAATTLTTEMMTRDTTSDANRLMTDGSGRTHDEQVLVVFQTYETDADIEYTENGTITNHDELVDAGQTYREIRYLSAHAVDSFDVTRVDEGHSLWCGEVAELEPGDSLRVDELRGDGDE